MANDVLDQQATGTGNDGGTQEGATGQPGSQQTDQQTRGGEQGKAGGGGQSAVIDYHDDMLVRIPGQKDPVKYKDLYARLQAPATRAAQEAKKNQETWNRQRTAEEQAIKAERARLEGLAQQLLARQSGGDQPDEFINNLGQAQYLDGKTAVNLVKYLQQTHQGSQKQLVDHINKQNQVIIAVVKKLKEMGEHVTTFSSSAEEARQSKMIDAALKTAGLPEQARDLASELLAAYEGDDLETEFPNLVKSRWEQIVSVIRGMDKERVTKLKTASPFAGRGGDGLAARGKKLTGRENPREVASMLWDQMEGTESPT